MALPTESGFPGRQLGAKPSQKGLRERKKEEQTQAGSATQDLENCPDPSSRRIQVIAHRVPSMELDTQVPKSAQPRSPDWLASGQEL